MLLYLLSGWTQSETSYTFMLDGQSRQRGESVGPIAEYNMVFKHIDLSAVIR